MADVTLTYKGSDILELSDSGSATLKTGGKYCEDDIAVEYVKPSGGTGTLEARALGTLTSYSNHSLTTIAKGTFYLSNLVSIDCPNVTKIERYGLGYSEALTGTAFFPKAIIDTSAFQQCKLVDYIVFDGCESWMGSFATNCQKVKAIDAGVNSKGFGTLAFASNALMDTLIIRRSSAIATLGGINVFSGTPFKSGGTGGTIYIPKALYDHLGDGTTLDYKSATNWSTIDGYGTITWAQIEGSYYETHYADGTVIS